MEDPREAHARRGAHFTFNAAKYSELVKELKKPITVVGVVAAPSFDHKVKDPIEEDIEIEVHHRIVIIEGNYVLLNIRPWREIAASLDMRYLVTVDIDEARRRIIPRHLAAGIAKSEEDALYRVNYNDIPNGEFLLQHVFTPYEAIGSITEKLI